MSHWRFPKSDGGEKHGINANYDAKFRGTPIASLAREICQNSLDARVDYSKPVEIKFILSDIKRDDIPGINDLTSAVELCREFWLDNKKTINFFNNAIKVCNADSIRVLRISDYNTTGLTGSDKIKSSPWQDLVKSSGVSNKTGESGGSYGIGKSAPYACSDLRTIFYNTLDQNGLKAYQGVAKLVSFQYPDKKGIFSVQKGEVTQGKGYYGEASDNSAVRDSLSLDGYTRNEVGTDVYVLGFVNQSEWISEIIKAVIDGYLISILQDDLEITVNDIVIDTNTINELVEKYKEEIPLAYNYYEVLRNEKSICIKEDFQGLGELELYVLIHKDFKRKVLMSRNNGMKIFDKQNISSTIQFAGICILKDKKLNEYFREMENPQHNNWESDRHSNKKEAEKMKRALFSFIKNCVLEIGKSTVSDEMDAIGAGEFIPDMDVIQSTENSKIESINNEIKTFTQLEKIQNIKADKGAQSVIDKDINGDEIDYGVIDSESEFPANEYEHGDGKYKGGNGSNSDGKGSVSENGSEEIRKTISIKPLKLRLFMFDNKSQTYKLSFATDKSAQDAYIEISVAGEQSNSVVEIKDAKTTENDNLIHKNNKIYIGNIENGKVYSLLYSIRYNEICSMGVLVHGYKI